MDTWFGISTHSFPLKVVIQTLHLMGIFVKKYTPSFHLRGDSLKLSVKWYHPACMRVYSSNISTFPNFLSIGATFPDQSACDRQAGFYRVYFVMMRTMDLNRIAEPAVFRCYSDRHWLCRWHRNHYFGNPNKRGNLGNKILAGLAFVPHIITQTSGASSLASKESACKNFAKYKWPKAKSSVLHLKEFLIRPWYWRKIDIGKNRPCILTKSILNDICLPNNIPSRHGPIDILTNEGRSLYDAKYEIGIIIPHRSIIMENYALESQKRWEKEKRFILGKGEDGMGWDDSF